MIEWLLRIIFFRGDFNMLNIRLETPEDVDSIRYVNEQAFGQKEEAE